MNPKATRSSLEMLIDNMFKDITEQESDPLPGYMSVSYTVTALILNIRVSNLFFPFCEVGFFFFLRWTGKREPYNFSSVREKSSVAALCRIVLPNLACATVHESRYILSHQNWRERVAGESIFRFKAKMTVLYLKQNKTQHNNKNI